MIKTHSHILHTTTLQTPQRHIKTETHHIPSCTSSLMHTPLVPILSLALYCMLFKLYYPGWHRCTAGSVATSQLQGPGFEPELGLLSVYRVLHVLSMTTQVCSRFPEQISQKHAELNSPEVRGNMCLYDSPLCFSTRVELTLCPVFQNLTHAELLRL